MIQPLRNTRSPVAARTRLRSRWGKTASSLRLARPISVTSTYAQDSVVSSGWDIKQPDTLIRREPYVPWPPAGIRKRVFARASRSNAPTIIADPRDSRTGGGPALTTSGGNSNSIGTKGMFGAIRRGMIKPFELWVPYPAEAAALFISSLILAARSIASRRTRSRTLSWGRCQEPSPVTRRAGATSSESGSEIGPSSGSIPPAAPSLSCCSRRSRTGLGAGSGSDTLGEEIGGAGKFG
jgi:hypothetical protein